MLLNLDSKAEESQQANVPYFKGPVRNIGVGVGGYGKQPMPQWI